MKATSPTNDTFVVKLGVEYFTTSNTSREDFLEEVEEAHTKGSGETTMEEKKKHKGEKKDGRFYRFVKKHFLTRRGGPTNVQEIHIVPEGDELRWARRSAGSAASRSSEETTSSESDRLEVVHDMADEYIPEAYDQEMPQSHTTDQPRASRGRKKNTYSHTTARTQSSV